MSKKNTLTKEQEIAAHLASVEHDRKVKAMFRAAGFKCLQFKGADIPVVTRCPHQHQFTQSPAETVEKGCPVCAEIKIAIRIPKAQFLADLKVQEDLLWKAWKKTRRHNTMANAPADRYTLG